MRKSLLLIFGLCLLFSAGRLEAKGPTAKVQGNWAGRYFYPDSATEKKAPVQFGITFIQNGGRLSGGCVEPNTFGDDTSSLLFADLKGKLGADGAISWTKQMDGTAGVKHAIEYKGVLSKDGKSISGTWAIRADWTGKFELSRR